MPDDVITVDTVDIYQCTGEPLDPGKFTGCGAEYAVPAGRTNSKCPACGAVFCGLCCGFWDTYVRKEDRHATFRWYMGRYIEQKADGT